MHELKEAEIQGQLFLGNTAVRPEPRTQQRPESFHGIDMNCSRRDVIWQLPDLTKAIVIYGRPQFASHVIDDDKQVKIAAIYPDFM